MSERRFQKKVTTRESVQQSLGDSGIVASEDWRQALDLETPLAGEEFEGSVNSNFDALYVHLGESIESDDQIKIEQFIAETDSVKKLAILQSMSLPAAISAISKKADFERTYAYKNLIRRLNFYQDLSQGKATKIVKGGEEYNGEYFEDETVVPIQASGDAYPIKLGIARDLLYSAMIGSPELAAVKIATSRINRDIDMKGANQEKIKNVVKLFGYYSGIHEESIGQWEDLCELYSECVERVGKKFKDSGLDDRQLEHKAVLLAARKLEGAYNYNGVINTSESPYSAGFKEAITIGQLGYDVMRQMRGMRLKIQETDLHNAGRFIGKSGNNRYAKEKRGLDKDIGALENFIQVKDTEAVELMTKQKNKEAIERASLWFRRDSEKHNRWWEKSKAKIALYDIDEIERDSIYASVEARYKEKIKNLETEYNQEVERLNNRTPEGLLEALRSRKEVVDRRYEKRKSLAQKALDLHFHFNHEGPNHGSQPFGQIDWINKAPFGVIKRAHRLLSEGVGDYTIMRRALAEVSGESVESQAPDKFINSMVGTPRYAWRVAQNFEKFAEVNEDQHLSIFLEIIRNGGGQKAVDNIEKFTGITPNDHLKIVQTFNESGYGSVVMVNFETFDGIRPEEKRDVIFAAVKSGGGYQVASNFDKYSEIIKKDDHDKLILEIIKAGNIHCLNNRGVLDKFNGLHGDIKKMIESKNFEFLPQILEAGFSIEEVTRFPFLISPLVMKK